MKWILLTRDDLKSSYAIIRHNVRTYRSAGVVGVVKGRQLAQSTLQKLEAASAGSSDHHQGWRYFIEKTHQTPGIDPAEATLRRQQELEVRESTAMQEMKTNRPSGEPVTTHERSSVAHHSTERSCQRF